VFDLDDRMARLRGIEHNAGTELRVRDGRQQPCVLCSRNRQRRLETQAKKKSFASKAPP
jgi:hypothetical protein